MCTNTPQSHGNAQQPTHEDDDQPMAGIEEERRPSAQQRQVGTHERREGEGVPNRLTVAEYGERKRAQAARGERELQGAGAEWRFVPALSAVVHAPMGKCSICEAYAHHIRDSLLGDEYQDARKAMVNDLTSRQKGEMDLMRMQLRATQSERDVAVSRIQDLERQVGILREDRNSFRDSLLQCRQQLEEREDEPSRPDKKRARRSSRERTPPMAQYERQPSLPPRRSRSPRQDEAAEKQPSRDKGKGRAIETPQEPPPMAVPVYDPYYDNDDGSDWDDGPLAYSNARDAQQFRENEDRRIAEIHARREAGLPDWEPSPQKVTAETLMTKAEIKARRKKQKAAEKEEAARTYAAALQQPSTSTQGGVRPPLHQRLQPAGLNATTYIVRGGRHAGQSRQLTRYEQALPASVWQWQNLQAEFRQEGNYAALRRATSLVQLLQEIPDCRTTEFRLKVLSDWERPAWAGRRHPHPLAPPRPATNLPAVNQPNYDDPPEKWATWLWIHPLQTRNFPGVRIWGHGINLRTIRGHILIGRYAPKGSQGQMEARIAYQRVAALMVARPGRYRELCTDLAITPALTVRNDRFPVDPSQSITEKSVAEWYARSGVLYRDVDDAWTFASAWIEDQRSRAGRGQTQAQVDWEQLMASPPLNDPVASHTDELWRPPPNLAAPGAIPPSPPPYEVVNTEPSETTAFTDYVPVSRPRDWASEVDAELAAGQTEVRVHIAGSGLHIPPAIPDTPDGVYGADVEMAMGDRHDREEAVSMGTRSPSPDNAWSDGCFD